MNNCIIIGIFISFILLISMHYIIKDDIEQLAKQEINPVGTNDFNTLIYKVCVFGLMLLIFVFGERYRNGGRII